MFDDKIMQNIPIATESMHVDFLCAVYVVCEYCPFSEIDEVTKDEFEDTFEDEYFTCTLIQSELKKYTKTLRNFIRRFIREGDFDA